MGACTALVYCQKSVLWTLVKLVIISNRCVVMHKSSQGDQRSSTFNFKTLDNAKEGLTNVARIWLLLVSRYPSVTWLLFIVCSVMNNSPANRSPPRTRM